MKPDILMMVYALFPDHVDIRQVPPPHIRVNMHFLNPEFVAIFRDGKEPDDNTKMIEQEETTLEEIADGVYAGMSKKSHVVYVMEKENEQ